MRHGPAETLTIDKNLHGSQITTCTAVLLKVTTYSIPTAVSVSKAHLVGEV